VSSKYRNKSVTQGIAARPFLAQAINGRKEERHPKRGFGHHENDFTKTSGPEKNFSRLKSL